MRFIKPVGKIVSEADLPAVISKRGRVLLVLKAFTDDGFVYEGGKVPNLEITAEVYLKRDPPR